MISDSLIQLILKTLNENFKAKCQTPALLLKFVETHAFEHIESELLPPFIIKFAAPYENEWNTFLEVVREMRKTKKKEL